MSTVLGAHSMDARSPAHSAERMEIGQENRQGHPASCDGPLGSWQPQAGRELHVHRQAERPPVTVTVDVRPAPRWHRLSTSRQRISSCSSSSNRLHSSTIMHLTSHVAACRLQQDCGTLATLQRPNQTVNSSSGSTVTPQQVLAYPSLLQQQQQQQQPPHEVDQPVPQLRQPTNEPFTTGHPRPLPHAGAYQAGLRFLSSNPSRSSNQSDQSSDPNRNGLPTAVLCVVTSSTSTVNPAHGALTLTPSAVTPYLSAATPSLSAVTLTPSTTTDTVTPSLSAVTLTPSTTTGTVTPSLSAVTPLSSTAPLAPSAVTTALRSSPCDLSGLTATVHNMTPRLADTGQILAHGAPNSPANATAEEAHHLQVTSTSAASDARSNNAGTCSATASSLSSSSFSVEAAAATAAAAGTRPGISRQARMNLPMLPACPEDGSNPAAQLCNTIHDTGGRATLATQPGHGRVSSRSDQAVAAAQTPGTHHRPQQQAAAIATCAATSILCTDMRLEEDRLDSPVPALGRPLRLPHPPAQQVRVPATVSGPVRHQSSRLAPTSSSSHGVADNSAHGAGDTSAQGVGGSSSSHRAGDTSSYGVGSSNSAQGFGGSNSAHRTILTGTASGSGRISLDQVLQAVYAAEGYRLLPTSPSSQVHHDDATASGTPCGPAALHTPCVDPPFRVSTTVPDVTSCHVINTATRDAASSHLRGGAAATPASAATSRENTAAAAAAAAPACAAISCDTAHATAVPASAASTSREVLSTMLTTGVCQEGTSDLGNRMFSAPAPEAPGPSSEAPGPSHEAAARSLMPCGRSQASARPFQQQQQQQHQAVNQHTMALCTAQSTRANDSRSRNSGGSRNCSSTGAGMEISSTYSSSSSEEDVLMALQLLHESLETLQETHALIDSMLALTPRHSLQPLPNTRSDANSQASSINGPASVGCNLTVLPVPTTDSNHTQPSRCTPTSACRADRSVVLGTQSTPPVLHPAQTRTAAAAAVGRSLVSSHDASNGTSSSRLSSRGRSSVDNSTSTDGSRSSNHNGSSSSSTAFTPTSSRSASASANNSSVLPRELTCVVCMEAPRSVLLLPCKHLIMCGSCFDRLAAEAAAQRMISTTSRSTSTSPQASATLPRGLVEDGSDSEGLQQSLLQHEHQRSAPLMATVGGNYGERTRGGGTFDEGSRRSESSEEGSRGGDNSDQGSREDGSHQRGGSGRYHDTQHSGVALSRGSLRRRSVHRDWLGPIPWELLAPGQVDYYWWTHPMLLTGQGLSMQRQGVNPTVAGQERLNGQGSRLLTVTRVRCPVCRTQVEQSVCGVLVT